MKRVLLVSCLVGISISLAEAGSERYSTKETVAPPPCPSWYADKEWNVNLWAAYAFTHNDYPRAEDTVSFGGPLNRASSDHDRYLEADHAWGGGIDAKYFVRRFFGIGIEGFGLNAPRSFGTVRISPPPPGFVGSLVEVGTGHEERLIGALLGTFTLRYPIGCSRFAPYVWIGGGGIFGGGEVDEIVINDIPAGAFLTGTHRGSETKAIGRFGGGFEMRLTPRIGWTNDFSWNVVSGGDNNFGMARTGINFAF